MHNTNQQTTSLESGIPSVGSIVWAAGRTRAQQAISLYTNLDYLRPYFDVQPKEVAQRLLHSLIPIRSSREEEDIKPELYGPSMIVFTLSAILIYQMKLSSHSVQDGTLIGTSFLVCFGYWIGASFAISSFSFIFNTRLSLMQILSINGYALFSHCVVLVLATFIHTSHDHLLFYVLWAVLGGVAAIRMATIIMSRTINPRYRIFLGLLIAVLHMVFLLYLHFAYHELAETVAHALNNEATIASDIVIKSAPSVISPLKILPRRIRSDLNDTRNIAKLIVTTLSTIIKP